MAAHRSLYERVLGEHFLALDDAVARFHRLQGRLVLSGHCEIIGAEHRIARWIARILRLPTAHADVPFGFELDANGDREIWIRRFPGRNMRSRLSSTRPGVLVEKLGPARLEFGLSVDDGRLSMRLQQVSIAGLRWPRRWMPEVWAFERGYDSAFHFDVGARWHGLGTLAAYRGTLDLDSEIRR